jgi:hypothetical protein
MICNIHGISTTIFGTKQFIFSTFNLLNNDLYQQALEAVCNKPAKIYFIDRELIIQTPIGDHKVYLQDDRGCLMLLNEKREVMAREIMA